MRAAIDFGISNIDAVARIDGQLRHWTRASDGSPDELLLRMVLEQGGLDLSRLGQVAVTGGRHRALPQLIGECAIIRVGEVQAIGRGGQALAGLHGEQRAAPLLVVSAGSGTAVVVARGDAFAHVTGSAVGGGTLLGLGRLLLNTADPHEIDALALRGDPNGADLSLGDVISGPIGALPADATAVNFGRVARESRAFRREDLAAALVTLVGQVIAVIAINAARAQQTEHVVVTGHLTDLPSVRQVLLHVGDYYGMPLSLPTNAGYATAVGALLCVEQQCA
jgi:type II pantothenate kinase